LLKTSREKNPLNNKKPRLTAVAFHTLLIQAFTCSTAAVESVEDEDTDVVQPHFLQ